MKRKLCLIIVNFYYLSNKQLRSLEKSKTLFLFDINEMASERFAAYLKILMLIVKRCDITKWKFPVITNRSVMTPRLLYEDHKQVKESFQLLQIGV